MIGRITGRLHLLKPGEAIVDVSGVGYLVSTTLRAFHDLATVDTATLWVHTQVRADAIVLYGFCEEQELRTFQRLITIAGVGPRTALAILSTLMPDELAAAVESGNSARIQRSPGVGRKTAERILLELRGKLPHSAEQQPSIREDAVSALVNLGYAQKDAARAVDQVLASSPGEDLSGLLRLVLQRL